MFGGQGTSGPEYTWLPGDQCGGAQTRLRNLQFYVIVVLFDTVRGARCFGVRVFLEGEFYV